ncbi:MAG: CbbQ/NirQ/NorQ/GpvN family protein [Bdellovibrionaceae bacterium]|jgi:nitric oxide reductase NorQ protein|nr:CbbQ/NirQ/NorQ/GpvN family protein [Pseudobdellovibrionaceae bacterium]
MSKVFYKPIDQEVEVLLASYKLKLPLLLKGPTGCGKSRFVEAMAEKLKLKMYTVACNDETSAADLLGRYLVKGSETIWQDGPVTTAVRNGGILYLDEIAEAREDIISVLHSLSDHRRELYIDRHNETLSAPDDFMMIVSFNPGYQQSFKEMKPSTRQRFISLAFDYPEFDVETEIIQIESGLDLNKTKTLVKLSNNIRKLDELGLAETVSTRLIVGTAKLINNGLHPRLACDVGMVQSLSDDLETSRALKDLVSLSF